MARAMSRLWWGFCGQRGWFGSRTYFWNIFPDISIPKFGLASIHLLLRRSLFSAIIFEAKR